MQRTKGWWTMFTLENIESANKELGTVDISKGKGKTAYVMVNERVKAFRKICPSGSITTEIISIEDGVVTMRAIVSDEGGNVIATGMAQEKESSTFINKTSFIENCETSAVGRALGFAGIGIDGSMASAEEVANAIIQQDQAKTEKVKKQYIDSTKIKALTYRCKERKVKMDILCKRYGVESFNKITEEMFLNIFENWEVIVKECGSEENSKDSSATRTE